MPFSMPSIIKTTMILWRILAAYNIILPISKYVPTSVMIISKKSCSAVTILTVQLKVQLSNDYSNFFYKCIFYSFYMLPNFLALHTDR